MKYRKLTAAAGLVALLAACADYDTISDDRPDAVHLQVAAVSDSTVSLTWSASEDLEFRCYKVYYDTTDVVDTGDHLSDTLMFDFDVAKTVRGLQPATCYYFRVFVFTDRGTFSASNEVSVVTATRIPVPVRLALAQAYADTVRLAWSANSDADFLRYLVFADTHTVFDTFSLPARVIDQQAATTCTLGAVVDTERTWFVVYVEDRDGHKAASNRVANHPTILSIAAVGDTSVSLHWLTSISADFGGYKLYRDTVGGVGSSDVPVTPVLGRLGTDFTDGTVLRGGTYYYRLAESDSSGTRVGWSNEVRVVVP